MDLNPQPGSLRYYLYALIAFAIACLLAYILLSMTSDTPGGAAAVTADYVVPAQYRQRILDLDRRGLDEAYVKHLERLFSTWVGDIPTLSHDPTRITKGLANARQAWVLAQERIEARERK